MLRVVWLVSMLVYVLRIQSDGLQELLDHLEGMLSNEAVVVTVGQAIVEVKPQVGDPVAVLALFF